MEGRPATVDVQTALKGFERFVQKVMREWKFNGGSVAVIKDGEIIRTRIFEPLDVSMKVAFSTNLRGDIDRVALLMEPTVSDIVFTRVADERMRERAFLEPFAGTYQMLGYDMPVTFKGDVLQVAIPGIPEYELDPIRGTEFALKGLSGITVEFVTDTSGKVTEAIVTASTGVYTATRKE